MPNFNYLAAEQQSGSLSRGRVDADNERHARQLLRARGLLPLEVTASTGMLARHGWRRTRLSQSELGWLTLQLSTLLSAGLTLEAALSAVIEQTDRKSVADLLAAVRADIRAGHRLCDAMAAQPKEFPALYCALIEAGESSGELARVMERLADYTQSQNVLRQGLLTALIYPAIVSCVALIMVVFLLSHVVPQIIGALRDTGQGLPWPTEVLLLLSDFANHWGLLVLGVALLALAALRVALRSAAIGQRWDRQTLRLPVLGHYIRGINTERFASTLSILSGSGVPLLTALAAAGKTVSNTHMRAGLSTASTLVREGSSLASALRSQAHFEPVLIHLIESGERTGRLPLMLDRAAQTLSRDLSQKLTRLTALLEPAVTLIMGVMVLFIVLAIMLPIIEINQLIQ